MTLATLVACATCHQALTQSLKGDQTVYRHPVTEGRHDVVPVDASQLPKVLNRCHTGLIQSSAHRTDPHGWSATLPATTDTKGGMLSGACRSGFGGFAAGLTGSSQPFTSSPACRDVEDSLAREATSGESLSGVDDSLP
jgi:hypothetical protein